MKRIIVSLIIISGAVNASGQDEKSNYWGGHVSFGKSNYSVGGSIGQIGSHHDYTGGNYLSIGFDYFHRNSEIFEVCTGISVTSNNITDSYTTYSWGSGGGSNTSDYDKSFFIFSVPLRLKAHFLKYLFAEGGVCLNYHPNMGYTWGIGSSAGIGIEYMFKSGITVSLTPIMQWNLLNIGNFAENSIGTDKLIQKGINIGMGYRF